MKKNIVNLLLTFAIVNVVCINAFAQRTLPSEPNSPWSMERLSQTPDFEIVSDDEGVKGIIYKSVDYRGESKEVFAYYATPGSISGDASKDKNLPAVVCVHGGGGRAFDQWVKIWAERGYAAISMDLRGYGKDRVLLPKGFQEGPEQITPNFVANDDQTEDWFYQAVSDVVLAHSLIRSFPEVDSSKTAITGISWGGIMTTLVTGLDPRFKASVPVYGCGYLYMGGSMGPRIENNTELAHERWYEQYDPALYMKDAKIPVLFVNGTNDAHFYIDQWTRTTELVSEKQYSMRYRMVHGHYEGWAPKEIYTFIDNVLDVNAYVATPEFKKLKFKKNTLSCKIQNLREDDKVSIIYTNDSLLNKDSKWEREYISFMHKDNSVNFKVNEDCKVCYISVETKDFGHFSSKIFF
ncbi:MAG: alpha/beta fold hydrolase [Rikenellaceae bacterium]